MSARPDSTTAEEVARKRYRECCHKAALIASDVACLVAEIIQSPHITQVFASETTFVYHVEHSSCTGRFIVHTGVVQGYMRESSDHPGVVARSYYPQVSVFAQYTNCLKYMTKGEDSRYVDVDCQRIFIEDKFSLENKNSVDRLTKEVKRHLIS